MIAYNYKNNEHRRVLTFSLAAAVKQYQSILCANQKIHPYSTTQQLLHDQVTKTSTTMITDATTTTTLCVNLRIHFYTV